MMIDDDSDFVGGTENDEPQIDEQVAVPKTETVN